MTFDLCVTLDNKNLVMVGKGIHVIFYDIQKQEVIKSIPAHKDKVPWVAATPDGKFILTASYTETVIWNAYTMESICTIEE